ncbi:MAG: DUF5698 domain-containing protein [Candidatus Eisenbacteria bacterium]|jgi:uncharacterized protein YebE (UPF0316 family)
MDWATLGMGIVIFCARIVDVSLGTMRVASIIQGRTRSAFILGFLETGMWVFIIASVLQRIAEKPIVGIFYALGFSTGNVVGIMIERRLAYGNMVVRAFVPSDGEKIAAAIYEQGFGVTLFPGKGVKGPVTEVCVVCRRGEIKQIIDTIEKMWPGAFYVTEHAGTVRGINRPIMQPLTGWRGVHKKK